MRAQFTKLDLDFTRIAAVDANALKQEQIQTLQANNLWTKSLTRGEMACFLSHASALQQLIADNVAYGVILEDDALLSQGASYFLRNANWLDAIANRERIKIDLVKLETSGKKVWLGQNLACGEREQFRKSVKPLSENGLKFSLAALKSTHIMAAAYLISRAGAQHLLEQMQKNSAPFDHFLFNYSLGIAQQFSLYQLQPAIVIQANMASTLEGERSVDKQRARHQRSLSKTLTREILRLFQRGRVGLWGIKTNLFTHDRWTRVHFKQ